MLILLAESDDTVTGTAVVSARVLLHQVANVDDKTALDDWHWDPILGRRVPHLQTFGSRLLQQDCDGTEVGVGGD